MTTRIETDSLGDVLVPAKAYWGAHTARALDNFTISGIPVSRHPHLVRALAMVKNAVAQANCELGIVTRRKLLDRDAAQSLLEFAVLPVRSAGTSGA